MLTPILAQRIQAYAVEHQPDVEAMGYAGQILARLWAGDANVLALLIIDPEGGIPTGHLLAEAFPGIGRAQIIQLRADQNVGDAKIGCVQRAVEWAIGRACPQTYLNVHRDAKSWQDKGFKLVRHVLMYSTDRKVEADSATV